MKFSINLLGSKGLVTDIDAQELVDEAITAGANFRCKTGYVAPAGSYETYVDISATGEAQYLVPLQDDADYFWIFPLDNNDDGVCEKIYATDGTTLTNLTRQTASVDVDYTSDNQWNGCNLHGVVILNNGEDNPQYTTAGDALFQNLQWDASHDWDDYDGVGSAYAAKVIRAHKNFLFALNITDATTRLPSTVHWSGDALPGAPPVSWDFSDPTEVSNRRTLSETDGDIVDGLTLRDQFIVYKQDAVYSFTFTGEATYVFQSRPIFLDRGIYAQDCVCEFNGLHFVVGDGRVYTHDGNAPKDILYGKNADLLFDDINQEYYQRTFVVHHRPAHEIWICYPSSTYTKCNKALVYNYKEETWTPRTIPDLWFAKIGVKVQAPNSDTWDYESTMTWDSESELTWAYQSYSVIGDSLIGAGMELWHLDEGFTADGADPGVYIERSGLMMGGTDTWGLVTEAYPKTNGSGSFKLYVGHQSTVDGAVTWSAGKTVEPGVTRKVSFRVNGPVHAWKVEGSGDWRLYGIDFYVSAMGGRR